MKKICTIDEIFYLLCINHINLFVLIKKLNQCLKTNFLIAIFFVFIVLIYWFLIVFFIAIQLLDVFIFKKIPIADFEKYLKDYHEKNAFKDNSNFIFFIVKYLVKILPLYVILKIVKNKKKLSTKFDIAVIIVYRIIFIIILKKLNFYFLPFWLLTIYIPLLNFLLNLIYLNISKKPSRAEIFRLNQTLLNQKTYELIISPNSYFARYWLPIKYKILRFFFPDLF